MNWVFVADTVSLLLMTLGSFFVFSAAVGVARFRDSMSRLHSVTKPQTIGLILVILGAIVRVTGSEELSTMERNDLGMLGLLVLFALMTSPITAQRLGRISRREGLYDAEEHMLVNQAPATKSVRKR